MRSLKILAAAAAFVVSTAVPAAAHVTVQPPEATQGGYAKLAFRVPDERDQATVKVEVQLPTDHKFASVSVRPLPGWTAQVTDTTVTWSGGRIEANQFQEFEISVGPLPEVDQLVFKALQTYEDGEVVRWIDLPSGDEEPEHPAPVLRLTPAAGDSAGGHGATARSAAPDRTDVDATAGDTATDQAAAADREDGNDDDGDGAVIGAYVLGALALALGAAGVVLARRRP